jgi:hypothetical protein
VNLNWKVIGAAIPIACVNSCAMFGQFLFIHTHLTQWPIEMQVLLSVSLEIIAVFLAAHAHMALVAGDSSLRLRVSSYAMGAIVGSMSYAHWAGPHLRPTFAAVATGLLSVSSPWLWGVHSRKQSKDQLRTMGLVEGRGVKLGMARWFFWPTLSFKVVRHAAWYNPGVTPGAAIAAYGQRELPAGRASRPRSESGESPKIRKWARSQDLEISDRGRIPAEIKADYYRELGSTPADNPPAVLQAEPIPVIESGKHRRAEDPDSDDAGIDDDEFDDETGGDDSNHRLTSAGGSLSGKYKVQPPESLPGNRN